MISGPDPSPAAMINANSFSDLGGFDKSGHLVHGGVMSQDNSASQESPTDKSNQINNCACVACRWTSLLDWNLGSSCAYHSCREVITSANLYRHGLCHLMKDGEYRCPESHCPQSNKTFKRLTDLKRHYKTSHCTAPKEFTCHILGCKYRTNGFARKDKLKSHFKNVHAGRAPSGPQPLRAIKPAKTSKASKGFNEQKTQ